MDIFQRPLKSVGWGRLSCICWSRRTLSVQFCRMSSAQINAFIFVCSVIVHWMIPIVGQG